MTKDKMNIIDERKLTIHLGVLEPPCRNLVIEEQVNLAESAVLGLGQAEPAPDIAEQVGAGIE
jgi:hypothetical protein